MKITKKQVEYVANLARLGISQKEKEKFTEELSAVLDFVDKLNQVKTDKIEPTAQVTGLENITRQDKRRIKDAQEGKKLLDAAPETRDGYIKVKTIL